MLADGSRASVSAQTAVFEQNNSAADTEVRKIIAANGGPAFKASVVASAPRSEAKGTATASTASAAASMTTLAAGANANAANVK